MTNLIRKQIIKVSLVPGECTAYIKIGNDEGREIKLAMNEDRHTEDDYGVGFVRIE